MDQRSSSISSFSKFLIYYLLPFLVITTTVLYFTGLVFEKKIILGSEINGAYKVNRMLHENLPNEIPIIGSSRAQGGYIPDSIAPNAFNYGIDGIGMEVHLLFIKKELEKQKKTPLIINIDMEGFSTSKGDIMNYLYNSSEPEIRKLVGKDFSLIHYVPVIKYYGYFEWYIKYYLNQRVNLTKKVNRGGSFELNIADKKSFDNSVAERLVHPANFKKNKVLESRLEKLIETHPDRKFYLVVAPYHTSYIQSFINKHEFDSYFEKLQQYSNVRFFNFSQLPLSDDCFYNTSHINYKGAVLFSALLKDSLQLSGGGIVLHQMK